MMTARKAGDGIDVGFFQRLGKLLPVKLFPHIRDQRAGVEIQVDLPGGQCDGVSCFHKFSP